jgi:hypothetical protein
MKALDEGEWSTSRPDPFTVDKEFWYLLNKIRATTDFF